LIKQSEKPLTVCSPNVAAGSVTRTPSWDGVGLLNDLVEPIREIKGE
jgi:hypothetical protein